MLVPQTLVQHIAEQLVVAVPAAYIVQRIQKEIRVLQVLQDFLAVATGR